jgi:cytosine deaminase
MAGGTLLRGVTLGDGRVVDVVLEGAAIAEVGARSTAGAGDLVHDLAGWVLLPAPAEPHAHLDKALTADLVDNPEGDLMGAIVGWDSVCGGLTVDDFARRARQAALRLLTNGCTAIRSHVNVGGPSGLRAVEALVKVKQELSPLMDLQLVALIGSPTDPFLLRDALDMGVDIVGGCPHLDVDPIGCLDTTVAAAAERGLSVDLHMDETLDPSALWVRDLARLVGPPTTRWAPGVTVSASHCVSHGMQDEATQHAVAEELAVADVAVITLPQTNLFLQGRGVATAQPRGLTGLHALLDAGVTVAGGADNLQDPFNTVGRADPLETAALLVMAGHLSPAQAYDAVTVAARRAMGLPPVTISPGAPAELLAVRAPSLRAAIADAPAERMVFAKGRLVAHTASHRLVTPDAPVAPTARDTAGTSTLMAS